MGLLDTIPTRMEIAHSYKAQGGLIAGVLPIHYPRALLRAFNILPMEIWGPPSVDPTYGTGHLQPYICSIVRNALSFLHNSASRVVDLILVPHACDSLQGLGSLLLDFVRPEQLVLPLYLPRGKTQSALLFLEDELRELYQRLKEVTTRSPSRQELLDCILREEEADQLLFQLHQAQGRYENRDYEFYRLVRTREYLPAERFIEIAQGVSRKGDPNSLEGVSLLLSGVVPEPMELLNAINEMGGRVVADDFACCSRRLYPPGRSENPFLRMAERNLGAPPSWSKGSAIEDRLDDLLVKINKTQARGVIFYNVKFCEPELFDLPALREGLKAKGIPSITIEVDINDPLSNQILTRMEAFMEMIA